MMQNQPKTDEEGFPDWEPVSFYDAPATIITQIYDGEGSLGRAARTLLDQSSLSPKERDSYVQRIKKSHGGNAALDTVIDIAMNPLTWLLVLTNPVTAKQFRNAKGKMLGGVSEMGKVGRKDCGRSSRRARAWLSVHERACRYVAGNQPLGIPSAADHGNAAGDWR
jgi:hypothetical protein